MPQARHRRGPSQRPDALILREGTWSTKPSSRTAARTSNPSGVRCRRLYPRTVEAVTGVPQMPCSQSPVSSAGLDTHGAVYGMGITQHTTGTDNVKAIANLLMLTGNIGRRGHRLLAPAGPEQRAGCLRHGCAAERLPGLPEGGRRRSPREVRPGLAQPSSTPSRA